MQDERYALGELDRRLGNLVRFGTVHAVDYGTARVQVDLGDLVTDWVPFTTPRAGLDRVWNPPDAGEQVVLLSPGEPSQGVVLGGLWQAAFPANGNAAKDRRITFKDGSVIEMDRDGSVLNVNVNAAGKVFVTVGGSILEITADHVKLTSNGSTLELSAAGVSFSGPRIDFN